MQYIKPLSDEEIINNIVKIISKYLPDARIILFGSRAKGTNKSVSDFDIAVDIKKIPARLKFDIMEEIEKLPTLKIIDVVYTCELDPDFKEIIFKTGKVIYEGSRVST